MTCEELKNEYIRRDGTLTGQALEQAALVSWGVLMEVTLGKAAQETEPSRVYDCFRLLLELQEKENVVSESLGDWRVEYRESRTLREAARGLLRGTELLYRGWPQ